jgi:integrase
MITGSLQTKNNQWYAVLNLYVDGKRKPKWVNTGLVAPGNKRAANQALKDTIQEYEERERQVTPQIIEDLFADYMKNWLNTAKTSVQPTTMQSYSQMVNGRIDKYFRPLGIKLGELQPLHIHEFYQGILQEGRTTNTVIHYHAIIRKALNQAFKLGLIPSNPADRVDRPKKNKFTAEHYSREEVATLLEATSDDPLNIAIYVGAYYGLRRSEVLGLRWKSLNFDQKTITVEHKVVELEVDGEFVPVGMDCLKTASSYRTLPMIPEVEKRLLFEKEKQEFFRKLFKKVYCKDWNGYVCVDQQGNIMRPNYVSEHFAWLLDKYGLRKIRFHDLRHTCASFLVQNKIQMKQVQEWMGHSDISTTGNIYSHLDFDSKLESADAIGSIIRGGRSVESDKGKTA